MKYLFFEAGISPNEFRKCLMKDIEDIVEIKRAVEERELREKTVRTMVSRLQYR